MTNCWSGLDELLVNWHVVIDKTCDEAFSRCPVPSHFVRKEPSATVDTGRLALLVLFDVGLLVEAETHPSHLLGRH